MSRSTLNPALSRRQFLHLSMAATGALLAACAAPTATQPEASGDVAKEAITVTFVEPWWAVPQYADVIDPVTQEITNRLQDTGMQIKFRSMLLDDHPQKYAVLYASGADFTCAFDAPWNKMTSLKDQGALLALEELLQTHAPNIIRTTGPDIIDFNFEEGPDGAQHLYGIPARFYYAGTSGVILREDMRKKYGVPAPTSQDGPPSLEPFLAAIKENEPDIIPLVQRTDASFLVSNFWPGARRGIEYAPGLRSGDVFENTEIVEEESLDWWQTAVAMIRDYYEKGYFPTEPPSVNQNVYTDYYSVEKTASFQDAEPEYKAFEKGQPIKQRVPTAETMGYDLSGQRAGIKGLGSLRQWNFVVFNANAPAEQQEAAAQIWNWFAGDQANADLWLMGIEGVNFIAEENKRYADPEGIDPARNYRRQWFVSGITGEFARQPIDLSEEAAAALEFFTNKANFAFTALGKFSVNTKEIETDLAALNAAKTEAFFGVSMGTVPVDEGVARYTQMMNDAGRQKVKEWYQAKVESWIADNKDFIDSFETNYP